MEHLLTVVLPIVKAIILNTVLNPFSIFNFAVQMTARKSVGHSNNAVISIWMWILYA